MVAKNYDNCLTVDKVIAKNNEEGEVVLDHSDKR